MKLHINYVLTQKESQKFKQITQDMCYNPYTQYALHVQEVKNLIDCSIKEFLEKLLFAINKIRG